MESLNKMLTNQGGFDLQPWQSEVLDTLWSDDYKPIGTIKSGGTIATTQEYSDQIQSVPWSHDIKSSGTFTLTYGGGYSYSHHSEQRIPQPHECPHCFRQSHPEPLTQRQAQMYDSHTFDPSYDVVADESGIVCIGADYEGPAKASSVPPWKTGPSWQQTGPSWQQMMKTMVGDLGFDHGNPVGYSISVGPWLPVGEPEKLPTEPDKLPIKFNDPNNWKPWEKPWYPVEPALDIKWENWHTSFPTPNSPGYDFSAYKTPEVKKPKRKKKK